MRCSLYLCPWNAIVDFRERWYCGFCLVVLMAMSTSLHRFGWRLRFPDIENRTRRLGLTVPLDSWRNRKVYLCTGEYSLPGCGQRSSTLLFLLPCSRADPRCYWCCIVKDVENIGWVFLKSFDMLSDRVFETFSPFLFIATCYGSLPPYIQRLRDRGTCFLTRYPSFAMDIRST